MPILWLRVALGFYALGLLSALLALIRQSGLHRIALPAMSVGMVFHFVSLAEAVIPSGPLALTSVHNAESLLALLVMAAFMIVYFVYGTTSPGIVIFPLVFVLTFAAATHQQPFLFTSPVLGGWLIAHIALIFAGYAALFLSFTASVLYLIQERRLKSKNLRGVMSRLPALQQIDEIGYRSLLFGFHDSGTDCGDGRGASYIWPPRLSRSKDFALHADVGGLYGHAFHPLECGMARAPRRISCHGSLRGRIDRVVGKLFQRDS